MSPSSRDRDVAAYALRSSSITPEYVATVERTLSPIGVASTTWTETWSGALRSGTWSGSDDPGRALACNAGTRDSRARVVLPDPETPVITVNRPTGKSTSSGCTVWIEPVLRWIDPWSKTRAGSATSRTLTGSSPVRNPASREVVLSAKVLGGPSAMTVPSSLPEPVRSRSASRPRAGAAHRGRRTRPSCRRRGGRA